MKVILDKDFTVDYEPEFPGQISVAIREWKEGEIISRVEEYFPSEFIEIRALFGDNDKLVEIEINRR